MGVQTYTMKDYGRKPTFASFLPGIAGIKGIPMWCFYVNRGQGVASFGIENKDHAIMEFYPAHQAYQRVKTTGFRTFIRKDGRFFEPFSKELSDQAMNIEMNTLHIEEANKEQGIKTNVTYYILPEEKLGALVRMVTITNTSEKECRLEVCDGMPALVPYGIGDGNLKVMTQTTKAWMQVENAEANIPFYRVRASMNDSAAVTEMKGGCFGLGVDAESNLLPVIVDPDTMFAYDTALQYPVIFAEGGLKAVAKETPVYSNQFPCCFFTVDQMVKPGQSIKLYEMIGQVEKREVLDKYLEKQIDAEYFVDKNRRADEIVADLCYVIATKTADPMFDAYCQYTYMDNVLRGGFPVKLPGGKIFWVYSRKHGDLERDYNYFSMLPEFYSQGNGNFRDVNQNRRCDTFFAPYVGRTNIQTFYSLIQLDGYNPLGVEKLTYDISKENAKKVLEGCNDSLKNALENVLAASYTPGQLYHCLNEQVDEDTAEKLFTEILRASEGLVNGDFKEGYWSDHWTYNMDLIEEYLSLFPEKEEEMLFTKEMTWFLSNAPVLPRAKRYEITDNGIRQYYSVDEANHRNPKEKLVRSEFGKGEVLKSDLMEKLLTMCAVKFATLDPYGMGIEMEGGKPGWYDALNGLPGLLGSSITEVCELQRMITYTEGALNRFDKEIEVLSEVGQMLEKLAKINEEEKDHIQNQDALLSFWNSISDVRETYRASTFDGVSGERTKYQASELAKILHSFAETISVGLKKAVAYGDGVCPAYFAYDVTEYTKDEEGIHPTAISVRKIPYFLEGPVRYLKLDVPMEDKKKLYDLVKSSDLYDKKLSMYKVNASLAQASFELGRCKAFTPGWLENESIWLHMEYKYLLEVLRAGLYEEFATDFHDQAIPFLDEKMYGRSVLENSSFLASSANPDSKIHGRGFVARLSGSTIEFISMWKMMMFGKTPFYMEDGVLKATFAPMIPAYLVGEEKTVSAMFMGKTVVNYHMAEMKDYIPGCYEISYAVADGDRIESGIFVEEMAEKLRNGEFSSVDVYMV